MVVHAYNPSAHKVETGGLRIRDQPGLQGKSLSQRKFKKKRERENLVHFSGHFNALDLE
jgi:hypothetical protein